MLIIQHSDEFLTVYAHTSQILVKEQQVGRAGQKIAEIGTSDAERPMLHFQIRKLGRPLDPRQFLPGVLVFAVPAARAAASACPGPPPPSRSTRCGYSA